MFRSIRRLFSTTCDRVKAVDFHPTEPLLAVALYNGTVMICNTNNMSILRTIRVDAQKPVRCVRWLPSLQWLVAGGDAFAVQCYDYNTGGLVASLPSAHTDFVRQFAVHPTQPQFLSCSDDATANLYSVERGQLTLQKVFKGHGHFVMDVKFNPKDPSMFATASLDSTIKFWGLTSTTPRFTLSGHQQGVNCVEFFPGSDKPYMASGSDDFTIKLWDYQTKSCVATLDGHSGNVTSLRFDTVFPILLSCSEDESVMVWNSMTMANETVLNYHKKRGWCVDISNGLVALGYDEGLVMLKLGRGSNVVVTMDSNGRTFWAKSNEVQSANLQQASEADEGKAVDVTVKDVSTSEFFVSAVHYNTTGRYVAVCSASEYAVFSALAWRSKISDQGKEFVWGIGDTYAVRTGSDSVTIVTNFTTKAEFRTPFDCERMFGGAYLGIAGDQAITFYTWEDHSAVGQIDVQATGAWWSPSGSFVAITTADSLFVLQLNEDYASNAGYNPETGSNDAFSLVGEAEQTVKKGFWYTEVFFFHDEKCLLFYAGGRIETVTRIDKAMHIVGYVHRAEKVYFCDSDYNFFAYSVPLCILEFVMSVAADDEINTASVPSDWRGRMCSMLEELGHVREALELADSDDKRFDLTLKIGDLNAAISIARKTGNQQKWQLLASTAMKIGKIDMLEESLVQAGDHAGLLLVKSCKGNRGEMQRFAETVTDASNVKFAAYFASGNYSKCIDILLETSRAPEASMMARVYAPSRMDECAVKWRELLHARGDVRMSQAIAVPSEYPNMFGLEPGQLEASVAPVEASASPVEDASSPVEDAPAQQESTVAAAPPPDDDDDVWAQQDDVELPAASAGDAPSETKLGSVQDAVEDEDVAALLDEMDDDDSFDI